MVLIERVTFDRCKFSSENEEEVAELQDFLSFYIDGAHWSEEFKKGNWDGYKRFYDRNNFFDYGILEEVTFGLDQMGIGFKIRDYYKKNNRDLFVTNVEIDKRLFYYQNEAVTEFLKENFGIIIVPTRGGKTFIASEVIRVLKEHHDMNFLFIVDTTDLFRQSVKEISGYLGVSENTIGTINDKGVKPQKITVAMIQTMVSALYRKGADRKRKYALEKYLRTVECLIVDEIQEFSSKKRVNAIKRCKNINYMLGLSATPFKQLEESIIQNLTIKGLFGGVVYEIPDEELQNEGFLAMDKILLINFNHEYRLHTVKLKSYRDFLDFYILENPYRNKVIVDVINLCKKIRFKTLVMFNSKKLGYEISRLTGLEFICGDDDAETRDNAKNRFLRGRGKVLLVSNIWKKGITLPEAEILFIADGGLEGSNILQKRGRVLGAVEGKSRAITLDIMDVGVNYFSEHSLNRLEVYSNKVGDDRMEVFMTDEFDLLSESIKEWLDEQ